MGINKQTLLVAIALAGLSGCASMNASRQAHNMCGDNQACYDSAYPRLYQQETRRILRATNATNRSLAQQSGDSYAMPTFSAPPTPSTLSTVPVVAPDSWVRQPTIKLNPNAQGCDLNPNAPYC